MLKDISFGQYYATESFVHKIDPRVKLLILIGYITLIFVVKNFYGFLACALFLCVAVAFSRVPVIKVLKSIKAILFLVILTALLNLFFYGGAANTVYFEYGIIRITDSSIAFAAFMAIRLIMLVLGSSVLTLTTTPVALTDGIESLLYPFKLIKFPVHELALIMSIALRFIPTLSEETARIMNAQKARGANFETGGLISRTKAMLPVLIPLLVSSFRRAEELGDAMDARCYRGSKGRTRYKKLKLGFRDPIAVLFYGMALTAVILTNIYFATVI